MNIRTVEASHGWLWIAQGIALFRKNPGIWLLMIATLFIGTRILLAIPLLGVIAALVMPNFIASLAHAAQAAQQGKPLRFAYLASGFLKSAAALITIGVISLLGQFLILIAMVMVGGEAFSTISKTLIGGNATPETMAAMTAAAPNIALALLIGLLVSLPLMMAVWFAPLLIFFDDLKPLRALSWSFWACVKNVLPFLLYGSMMLVPIWILAPLSLAARMPDLGLWLIAPIAAPSIYASYKDLFIPLQDAPQVPSTAA